MNGKGPHQAPDTDLTELDADALLRTLAESDSSFAEGSAIYDLVSKVGSLLRQMRNSAGLKQAELAERLSVSQGRISQIESGLPDHAPSLEMIARIALACGATPQVSFDSGESSGDEEAPRVPEQRFAGAMRAPEPTPSQASAVSRAQAKYGDSS